MTNRSAQPDTEADATLRQYIHARERRSFVMVAGAGSGKTTSLIKALASILNGHELALKRSRQRVACITYTEIAAGEIWADVNNNPLIHVSTIHSFLWMIVKSFQADINRWVVQRIDQRLGDLRIAAANFGPRVQQKTRDKNRRDIERYELERDQIASLRSFIYGTGSNYSRGVLGHDDVIRMVTQFLVERPLFRTLVAQQFPFIFVDESQDTFPDVVIALKAIERQMRTKFCLGFFGDPMQQIYPTGVGEVAAEEGWLDIKKPENFRCPTSVLAVANAIRRDGDGLVQVRGRTVSVDNVPRPVLGTARMFVLPADGKRNERLLTVRDWLARHNDDAEWRVTTGASVKTLVIVHRMAAARLGFADLYSALNDEAPDAFKNGFLDASAWPLRPFVSFVIPLADAIQNKREFEVMTLLRNNSPLLARDTLQKKGVAEVLAKLRASSERLANLVESKGKGTNREVLELLRDSRLVDLDPRVLAYLREATPTDIVEDSKQHGEDVALEIAAMESFLKCPATQFWGYQTYLNEESPFSTQQGIKGAEFPRVLVILDDEEGSAHFQFSYDKYFGIAPLSKREDQNRREGKETAIERTRRLFYVCCTRATTDLAVVFFSGDVGAAVRHVRAARIFPDNSVHTLADLAT